MPIDLYLVLGSAPCRAVRLTAATIDLDINLKFINIPAGENMTPEYLKVVCDNEIFYNVKHSEMQDDPLLKDI